MPTPQDVVRSMAEPKLALHLTNLHEGELQPRITMKDLRAVPSENRLLLYREAVRIAVRWYSNPVMAPPGFLRSLNTVELGRYPTHPTREQWDTMRSQLGESPWVESCLFVYALWKTIKSLHHAPEGY